MCAWGTLASEFCSSRSSADRFVCFVKWRGEEEERKMVMGESNAGILSSRPYTAWKLRTQTHFFGFERCDRHAAWLTVRSSC